MQITTINKKNVFEYENVFREFKYLKDREKDLIDKTLLDIKKSRSVGYLLQIDNQNIGFIAISASRLKTDINGLPSIEIDYLFIDKRYRKQTFKELENIKASEYLLFFIGGLAKQWRFEFGLKFVILYPDMQNDSLIKFYQNLGFHKTKLVFWDNKIRETEYWMIKKL